MELYYRCSPSKYVIALTIVATFFIAILFVFTIIALNNEKGSSVIGCICMCLLVLIYIITFSFSPRYIRIEPKCINLKCMIYTKKFYYKDINSIERISAISGIREFGSNGIWGYIGILDSDENNKLYTLLNHNRRMIKIVYKSKNYIISCDNPDSFIQIVKHKI